MHFVQADGRRCGVFDEREFDLVLLDLRLPDLSGFDVCRALRAKSIAPIIVVTAQTDTHDLVAGLEAGADDYVTKPVVSKELAARIRAHLRRVQLHEHPAAKAERFGDVELRREQGVVLKAGNEVSLTKTEFRLLNEFADHVGSVLSRDYLLERVWGYEYLGDSRLVDAHVRRLRVKIEDHPDEPQGHPHRARPRLPPRRLRPRLRQWDDCLVAVMTLASGDRPTFETATCHHGPR